MFGIADSRTTVCDVEVDAGSPGHVVEHDRQRRRSGDRLEVLVEAFLRRLVVVRASPTAGRPRQPARGRARARSPRACRTRLRRPAPAPGRPLPPRPARRRAASRDGSASALRPSCRTATGSECRRRSAARASRRTAASSSEPSFVNGVIERRADAREWSAHRRSPRSAKGRPCPSTALRSPERGRELHPTKRWLVGTVSSGALSAASYNELTSLP